MTEIWKIIENTEGKYEISNTGRVISLNYGGHGKAKEMTPVKDKKGYMRLRITQNGKNTTKKLHRLVAIAFVPNPENKPEVNHKDGNKENNNADNLEWVTAHENEIHAYKAGLKENAREHCRKMGETIGKKNFAEYREKIKTPLIAVRKSDGAVFNFESQADAAKKTGAPQPNINKVLNGSRKSAHGYLFKYKGGDAKCQKS